MKASRIVEPLTENTLLVEGPKGETRYYVKAYRDKMNTIAEFVSYQIAKALGVHVPEIKLIRGEDVKALRGLRNQLHTKTELALVIQPAEEYASTGKQTYSGLEEIIAFSYLTDEKDYTFPDKNEKGHNIYTNEKGEHVNYDLLTKYAYRGKSSLQWPENYLNKISEIDIGKLSKLIKTFESMDLDRFKNEFKNFGKSSQRRLDAFKIHQRSMRKSLIEDLMSCLEHPNTFSKEDREIIIKHSNKIKRLIRALKDDSKAMLTPGGINLNPAQMSMQVKNEGEDFKFNFNGIQIDTAQVTGARFSIQTITPVTDLPKILGLLTQ